MPESRTLKKLDDLDIAFFLDTDPANAGPPAYEELELEGAFTITTECSPTLGVTNNTNAGLTGEGGGGSRNKANNDGVQWTMTPLIPTITGTRIRAAQSVATSSASSASSTSMNATRGSSPPSSYTYSSSYPSSSSSSSYPSYYASSTSTSAPTTTSHTSYPSRAPSTTSTSYPSTSTSTPAPFTTSPPPPTPTWKSSRKSMTQGIGMVVGAPLGLALGVAGVGVFAVGSALVGAGKVVNGVGQLLTGGLWDGDVSEVEGGGVGVVGEGVGVGVREGVEGAYEEGGLEEGKMRKGGW